MNPSKFHILYSDVGGVLGTNGWDTRLRQKIAEHFNVEPDDIESRHHLVFDSYERGHMGFEDYLRCVFFDVPRGFTVEEVRDYTYNESVAWPENIDFLKRTKSSNGLKIALISNEGRGLTEHRVSKFQLRELAEFMIFSNCVGYRKPDREIWRLALDLAQTKPHESIYLDDRKMFVDIAADMGFTAVHYVSLEDTSKRLRELGLVV
ncbi:MAG: HAD-IA family hydrolase [Bryobacteraceae bacterium]